MVAWRPSRSLDLTDKQRGRIGEHSVGTEDAVGLAAEAGCKGDSVEGAGEVALAEEREDMVADLEAGDPGAYGDDGTGGVGAGNQGGLV
jgi:hypothetical protein